MHLTKKHTINIVAAYVVCLRLRLIAITYGDKMSVNCFDSHLVKQLPSCFVFCMALESKVTMYHWLMAVYRAYVTLLLKQRQVSQASRPHPTVHALQPSLTIDWLPNPQLFFWYAQLSSRYRTKTALTCNKQNNPRMYVGGKKLREMV